MAEKGEKPVNIELIDVLRGIAILCVLGYHYHIAIVDRYIPNSGGVLQLGNAGLQQYYATFSPLNYLGIGVQFFLVISGFLIHYLFLMREQQGMNVRNFYLRRFWRIYPPYVMVLIFFAFHTKDMAIYHLFDPQGRLSLITHLLMVHNLFGDNAIIFGINPSFWSLALEMQLYLLYPVFLFFRGRFGMARWCKILMVIHVVVLLVLMYLKGGFPDKLAENTFVLHYWIVWALGALVAEGYYRGKPFFAVSGRALIALGLVFYCAQYFILVFSYFNAVCAAVLFAMALEYYLFKKPVETSKPGILKRFLLVTGLCSYSMYLIHQPLVDPLLDYFKIKDLPAWLRPFGLLPVFVVVFGLSYTLYEFVEKTSISLGKNFIRKLGS